MLLAGIEAMSQTSSVQEEKHLKNLRQITFGGDNAEAYFSPDGNKLCFQTNNPAWGLKCDQIYRLKLQAADGDTAYQPNKISTGDGRTTCSYYLPGNKEILYASTHTKERNALQRRRREQIKNTSGQFILNSTFSLQTKRAIPSGNLPIVPAMMLKLR